MSHFFNRDSDQRRCRFFRDQPKVEAALKGMHGAVIALIAVAAYRMAKHAFFDATTTITALATVSVMLFTGVHPKTDKPNKLESAPSDVLPVRFGQPSKVPNGKIPKQHRRMHEVSVLGPRQGDGAFAPAFFEPELDDIRSG